MRMNIMFGIDHVAHDEACTESARILRELATKLEEAEFALKAGDSYVLRDINGNRVGVADAFKD